MSLSSDFHDSKDSGDVVKSMDQGKSLIRLVAQVCLTFIPQITDLVLALFYLYFLFGPYMVLASFTETFVYILFSIKVLSMKMKLRKTYIKSWLKEWRTGSQGIKGWQMVTVSQNEPSLEDEAN